MYFTQVGLKMKENKDISSRADVIHLVDQFYGKVIIDETIGPFFAAINFEHHKPLMVDFWCFVLLDEVGYKTDVTKKHMHMRLQEKHFERWLTLFNETIDANFEGERANLAKQRAAVVGWSIQAKIAAK